VQPVERAAAIPRDEVEMAVVPAQNRMPFVIASRAKRLADAALVGEARG